MASSHVRAAQAGVIVLLTVCITVSVLLCWWTMVAAYRPPLPVCVAVTSPIDAVTLWVDGTDAEWRDGIKAARSVTKTHNHCSNRDPIVDQPNMLDELYYGMRMAAVNMPFLRTFYIVTQRPQRPWWLHDLKIRAAPFTIVVIHHDEFFDSRVTRPTYNSNVLEAQVCRIPGLAPHFILFNDDVLVTLPVCASDFFDGNGRPVVRLDPSPKGRQAVEVMRRRSAAIAAKTLNTLVPVLYTPHVPVPLRTADMQRLLKVFENEVLQMQPLRTDVDINLHFIASPLYATPSRRLTNKMYNYDLVFEWDPLVLHVVCINHGFGNGCRRRLHALLNDGANAKRGQVLLRP